MLVHWRIPSMKRLGVYGWDANRSQGTQHEATRDINIHPLDGTLALQRLLTNYRTRDFLSQPFISFEQFYIQQ